MMPLALLALSPNVLLLQSGRCEPALPRAAKSAAAPIQNDRGPSMNVPTTSAAPNSGTATNRPAMKSPPIDTMYPR
jgi:hypothetical protein